MGAAWPGDQNGVPPPYQIYKTHRGRLIACGVPDYTEGILNCTNASTALVGYDGAYWDSAWAWADEPREVYITGDARRYTISTCTAPTTIDLGTVAWTPKTNVTASVEQDDKKISTGCAKLVIADAFTTGIAATKDFTAINITGFTIVQFWIKSTVALTAGQVQLVLDNTAACATPLESLDIPALAANLWTRVNLTFATPANLTAVISVGINVVTDLGACTIYVSDIRTNSKIALTENYAGATATGLSYKIIGKKSMVRASRKTSDGTPVPESFDDDDWFEVNPDDGLGITGFGILNNELIFIKSMSGMKKAFIYYTYGATIAAWAANIQEVPTGYDCVAWDTVVNLTIGGRNYLGWLSSKGPVICDGRTVVPVGSELKDTFKDLDQDRLKYAQSVWDETEKEERWEINVPSFGSSYQDLNFVLDTGRVSPVNTMKLGSWWLDTGFDWTTVGGYKAGNGEWKKLVCDSVGYLYEAEVGVNDGAGTDGTRSGTVTAGAASTTLPDTGAAFFTSGNGLRGVWVENTAASDSTIERRRISSNTATVLTIFADDPWDVTPVAGDTYQIGVIRHYWMSKHFSAGSGMLVKTFDWLNIYTKALSSGNLTIKHYVDEGSGMPTTPLETQTIDMTESKHDVRLSGRGTHLQLEFESRTVDAEFNVREFNYEHTMRGKK